MSNYRLQLSYDGGRYDGWQRLGGDSKNNTIEQKIREVIMKMSDSEPEIFVGLRTEKGVHAINQIANVKFTDISDKRTVHIKDYELRNYLNRYLPHDIAIKSVTEVDERFNAQLNAISKTYIYRANTANIANVFDRRYSYHMFDKPNIEAMQEACNYFIGSHDFKLFTTAKKSKSTEKDILRCELVERSYLLAGEEEDNEKNRMRYSDSEAFYIRIKANDFLHNMARFMVGMILDIGNGLKKSEEVKKALDLGNIQMSLPAEAYGLFLENIEYK